MARSAEADLERTRIRIGSVGSLAGRLSGGQRQAIAVGRAVAWGQRVLLMDEPTAALGIEQQEKVGELVGSVAAHGVAILFITHNLPQVHRLCDRIVVLFHGRVVANLPLRGCFGGRDSELDNRGGTWGATPCWIGAGGVQLVPGQ